MAHFRVVTPFSGADAPKVLLGHLSALVFNGALLLQGKGERIRSIITRNARLGKTPIDFVFLSNSEADPADSIAPLLD